MSTGVVKYHEGVGLSDHVHLEEMEFSVASSPRDSQLLIIGSARAGLILNDATCRVCGVPRRGQPCRSCPFWGSFNV